MALKQVFFIPGNVNKICLYFKTLTYGLMIDKYISPKLPTPAFLSSCIKMNHPKYRSFS